MLYVKFGDDNDNLIFSPGKYFDNVYENNWFDDIMVKEMIKDIDKSEVTENNLIISPILGLIPVEKLSGGVKALILLLKRPDLLLYGTRMGDNCAKWIIKISKIHDITLYYGHIMDFSSVEPFDMTVLNDNSIMHTMDEFLFKGIEFLRRNYER